jgi:hypothetical protein
MNDVEAGLKKGTGSERQSRLNFLFALPLGACLLFQQGLSSYQPVKNGDRRFAATQKNRRTTRPGSIQVSGGPADGGD